MSQQERPERPRRRPKPAADEDKDPIDYKQSKPEPAPIDKTSGVSVAPAATNTADRAQSQTTIPASAREATVQLATRISPEVDAVLNAAAARTGQKKRALVEEAIMRTWNN